MAEDNRQEGGGLTGWGICGGQRSLSDAVTRTYALGSLPIGQRGRGSNLSRVAIYQMAEHHGRGQGKMVRRKRLLLRRGHCNNDVGAGDFLLMTPVDCTFNLVINKGDLGCVMCSSDQIERRMNIYRDEVGGVLRLGNLED